MKGKLHLAHPTRLGARHEALPGDWLAQSRNRAGLAAGLVLLATLLLLGGLFEPLEDRLTDVRARLLDRAPSGQIAILEIDARSLAELDSWPWPRRHHAAAVTALDAAGAELIAFDVDFSARSNAADDAAFASALQAAQPVILPVFHQRATDESGRATVIQNRPVESFGAAWLGGVNIYPGHDGMVRDYPAATWIGRAIQPSIATLVADSHQLGDRSFQPDWGIDARRIPRIAFVDLLRGKIPRSAIDGKRIIVGATAIELGDRYAVPRFGNVPGVMVQALAAESLLQGRAIQRSGPLPTLLAVVLLALAFALPRFDRFAMTIVPLAGVSISVFVVVPLAVQSRWPVSIDSAAPLFTIVAALMARIVGEVRRRGVARTYFDGETGLPNRRMLEFRLAAIGADGTRTILAAGAIERFATIGEAIGSAATSDLIGQTAARLGETVSAPVYRLAPDILAWPLANTSKTAASDQIEAISQSFRSPVETNAGEVDVALTTGLAKVPPAASAQAIEHALAAIGGARAGREASHWYHGSDPTIRRDVSLMGDLRRGMAQGEVRLAFQPKLDLKRRVIDNAEALVRWQHPVEGPIAPDRFIPLAEATGVVHELTAFVLREALESCARWRDIGVPMRVAANVSAADLVAPGFVALVERLLIECNAAPASLALEITESAYMISPRRAIEVLHDLRQLGIRLSIDDYGTGLSTLSYLKQLPVDELKIDKSFVTSLCSEQGDAIMVESTIDLAHQLGLAVVAEGVEDAATLDRLASIGCDYAQGYFIGRPMSFEDLTRLAGQTPAVAPAARLAA